jgi:phosphoribosylformylglycinamidine synthase
VVVSAAPESLAALTALAAEQGVPLRRLGTTGGDRLRIRLAGEGATGAAEERGAGVADALDEPLSALRDAWERGLPRALGEDGSAVSIASEDR